MSTFRVYLKNTISTVMEVEAEDDEQAVDIAFGRVGDVIFLNHTYPDMGDWETYGEPEVVTP